MSLLAAQPGFGVSKWTLGGLAVVSAGLGYVYLRHARRDVTDDVRLPPGPPGDASDLISQSFHLDFCKLGEKYGDIFCFHFGDRLVVVLNTMDLMKEAFIRRAEDFSDRPDDFDHISQLKDEIFTPRYNDVCKRDKKMCSAGLRKVGLGSPTPEQEARIQEELETLVSYLSTYQGEVVPADKVVYRPLTNILTSLMYGRYYDYEDPELDHVITMITDWTRATYDEGVILTCLNHEAARRKFGFWEPEIRKASAPWRSFLQDKVKEHKATFDPDNIRDFIDFYIREKGMDWDLETMTGTPLILTPDATDTLSIAITWSLKYLCANPEVQKRMQAEIDDVIGRNRKPRTNDRSRCPYVEAVVLETSRMRPVFGSSFPHATPKDRTVEFQGYRFPPDTVFFANIHGIHRDSRLFPDPDNFRPERFIDTAGKLKDKDKVVHFSVGKRVCMGEQYARVQHFLYLATVLQNFSVSFPPGEPEPSLEASTHGMANAFLPYNIVFSTR